MTMNRRTPGAMLLLAALSLTVIYAADCGRWTATPTRQADDYQQVRAARDDRVDTRFGVAGIAVTSIAPGQAGDHQQGMAIQRDGKILVGGASAGVGWAGARMEIDQSYVNFQGISDAKCKQPIASLKASLQDISACEETVDHEHDWYNRFAFIYYQFSAGRYRLPEWPADIQ